MKQDLLHAMSYKLKYLKLLRKGKQLQKKKDSNMISQLERQKKIRKEGKSRKHFYYLKINVNTIYKHIP